MLSGDHVARRWRRPRLVASALASLVGIVAVATPWAAPPVLRLTWYGQACFLLESAAGTRVLMDPLPATIGYTPPEAMRAEAVTISHEHGDHNNVGLVTGKSRVLRGLTPDGKGWVKIRERLRDVEIRSVPSYHDDERGQQRGLNTIFVFEVGGMRVAHLGDLGHALSDQQLSELGNIDVLLIPVGGFYTIDASQATRVVDQIRPRLVVVPMHYKTAALTIKELATVDAFLAGKPNVRRAAGNVLPLSPVKTRPSAEIVVLDYK
jgi:L-ascorbate metabolism protein UlaG (beta-lactamase superfamily)